MSLYQFSAAVDGWNRAHAAGEEAPSDDEMEDMLRRSAEMDLRLRR